MTVVPTIRLIMMRDGIEDFEYATILERLIKRIKVREKNTAKAEATLDKMRRQFASPQSSTLSETPWKEARVALAQAILDLQGKFQHRDAVGSGLQMTSITVPITADQRVHPQSVHVACQSMRLTK